MNVSKGFRSRNDGRKAISIKRKAIAFLRMSFVVGINALDINNKRCVGYETEQAFSKKKITSVDFHTH